jgi:hypothetical protein
MPTFSKMAKYPLGKISIFSIYSSNIFQNGKIFFQNGRIFSI